MTDSSWKLEDHEWYSTKVWWPVWLYQEGKWLWAWPWKPAELEYQDPYGCYVGIYEAEARPLFYRLPKDGGTNGKEA